MGWDSDQPPLNYMKRRLRYYERKRNPTLKLINNITLREQYGVPKLQAIIDLTVENIDNRIKQFQEAIETLESNGINE